MAKAKHQRCEERTETLYRQNENCNRT